ncbi:ankyrin [Xylaria sp. FL1042]|nr:ankyrin [Xylaria sp. FL1042]
MPLLFDLPTELVSLIFDEIVLSRMVARVIRIRRVSSLFKHFIDDSITRLNFFSQYQFHHLHFLTPYSTSPSICEAFSYLHPYLMYQVLKAPPGSEFALERFRLIAQTLCGGDDDLTCLSSLLHLAFIKHLQGPLDYHRDYRQTPEEDLIVAAAYLGREKECVQRPRVIEDIPCCWKSHNQSELFGNLLDVFTLQGNLKKIKLLISQCRYSCGNPFWAALPRILEVNSAQTYRESTDDRQAIFDFALDATLSDSDDGIPGPQKRIILSAALSNALSPKDFERVLPLLDPDLATLQKMLCKNVRQGRVEMVRYLLDRGVSPNFEIPQPVLEIDDDPIPEPIIEAIHSDQDEIFAMLLDYNADPAYMRRDQSNALMAAVWKGRIPIVKTLLDRGVDPNQGSPCPIVLAVFKENLDMFQLLRARGARLDPTETGRLAMAVAEVHGLSSMQDVLANEGISRSKRVHDSMLDDVFNPVRQFSRNFYRKRISGMPNPRAYLQTKASWRHCHIQHRHWRWQ